MAHCRSFLHKAERLGVPAKRSHRSRPPFTLHSGMNHKTGKAYIYGAHRLYMSSMTGTNYERDIACPWCGYVGLLLFRVGMKNMYMPDLARPTTVVCHNCNREATVEETVPASHRHELAEWLEGIPAEAPAYRTAVHERRFNDAMRGLARATPEKRRKMGLSAKPQKRAARTPGYSG